LTIETSPKYGPVVVTPPRNPGKRKKKRGIIKKGWKKGGPPLEQRGRGNFIIAAPEAAAG